MRVKYEIRGSRIIFEIKPSENEKTEFQQLKKMTSFYYKFDDKINLKCPHPDKLALVAILNLLPFTSDEMHIDWGVSASFEKGSKIITRIQIKFKSSNFPECQAYPAGLPSLAFSGGADSTAALCVMPNVTDCVFHRRSENPSKTLYDERAALHSCKKISMLGYNVHIVESDFEYLREPIGFPTDLSVGTPAILLADTREYSSIAYGTILESAYGTSGEKYRDYEKSSHYRLWNHLFSSAGLFYSLPIAGVSEIGSTLICRKKPLGKTHQSCIRGKWGSPCQNCWKCFRKSAIMSALDDGRKVSTFDYIGRIISSKEVGSKMLTSGPIKHEGVLTYCLERAGNPENELLDALKKLVRVGIIETKWMEKWYKKSEGLIDPNYSDEVKQKLSKILGTMTDEEEDCLIKWKNFDTPERGRILRSLDELIGARE